MLLTRRGTGLLAGAVLLVSGCAERGLASGPRTDPDVGTWAAVTTAAVGAAVVLAALVVLPARRPGGAGIASWVLGLQAGATTVAGAVVLGAAVRSEQLLGRPPDAEQAASLLRLTALDGDDSGFFTLVAVATVVLGTLLAATLSLAARCAADADPIERFVATAVLAIEAAASLVAVVLVALGFRHAGFVLPALALPILVAAVISAWPGLQRRHA